MEQPMTWFKVALIAALVCIVSACASSSNNTRSGFLPNYDVLLPSDDYEDTNLFVDSTFNREALSKIKVLYIPQFEVWINASESEFLNINPRHVAKLSHYMQSQMQDKLSPYYQVVTTKPASADDTVLTIEGAFTDVQFEPISLQVRDFVPIRLVYNAGKTAYLAATEQTEALTHVSLESAFYLGSSQNPVVMMTAHKELDAVLKADGTENVETVKAVLDVWINNFVTAMTKHRNVQ
ncbi:hypothetical protein N481_24105 [Pseudoalteromonas luteoviolacea S4047-1]|uniref:DUF3313 domain-containing protein n=2 Tax=Pseudoalteromonas luteoviolacea TaxID=43657 RepID=A0A0F6A941_9GAMM|nr:hypothetical protein N479_17220 [Pseudoalteromonas luteoviolacea S4054]KZN67250.1 hypothetical protein N481_24105 [Pseudoalteromonas luteoviolacea S4047-1]